MKVLEIPTDPVDDISPEALELVLEQQPIKAVQVVLNRNSSLDYVMPELRKRVPLALTQHHDVATIEDDAHGDLAYTYPRPRTIKSHDNNGRVLFCGSLSKALAPGLRIGWMVPGRYAGRAPYMKYISVDANVLQP